MEITAWSRCFIQYYLSPSWLVLFWIVILNKIVCKKRNILIWHLAWIYNPIFLRWKIASKTDIFLRYSSRASNSMFIEISLGPTRLASFPTGLRFRHLVGYNSGPNSNQYRKLDSSDSANYCRKRNRLCSGLSVIRRKWSIRPFS